MGVPDPDFRRALSHFAAGVTVVTTATPAGRRLGFTATAFSSLSLDPPLALVCAGKGKLSHAALTEGEGFAVNILSSHQEDLARRFADPRVADRFAGLEFSIGALGCPLLAETVAGLECRRSAVFDGGDHSIFVGEVTDLWHTDAAPLVHFAGRFSQLQDQSANGADHRADWLVGAPW